MVRRGSDSSEGSFEEHCLNDDDISVQELFMQELEVGPDQSFRLVLPRDVIPVKKGVHFTEDFKCIARIPGLRSTAQNFILECKVSGRRFSCLTLPIGDGIGQQVKGFPDIENFRAIMRSLDHFTLPRLV